MEDNQPFDTEEIPNEASLYYRIHKTKIDSTEKDTKKKIMPIAFDPQPKGSTEMSTDWCKYSTPIDTRNRAKVPLDNGIVSFMVESVVSNPFRLNVKHLPENIGEFRNQAHSVIFDMPPRKSDIGYRLKLRDICMWEIEL